MRQLYVVINRDTESDRRYIRELLEVLKATGFRVGNIEDRLKDATFSINFEDSMSIGGNGTGYSFYINGRQSPMFLSPRNILDKAKAYEIEGQKKPKPTHVDVHVNVDGATGIKRISYESAVSLGLIEE